MPKISELTAHSNQFKFQGFVDRFSTFQGMWEVLGKCSHHGACEASWSWFRSKKEAEGCLQISVLSFSAAWADFLLPLILLNSEENYTISIGIFTAFGFFEEINYSMLATMCIIYMLPILIVYFMLSSSFSEGFGSIGTTEK